MGQAMTRRSYDRQIRIDRPAAAHDGLQKTDGFAPLATVPARMDPGAGSERFANEQNAATAPAIFRFLYDPRLEDLSPTDRLVDLSLPAAMQTFDIQSVRWDGRLKSEIEVLATSRRS